MKIAPIDIAHRTFNRKMMGYDPDEVTLFLRDVAEALETVIREKNSLREALREEEMNILEYKERDELLKNTITTATKMSEKLQKDAERESRLIINDAKHRADIIVRDSKDSLKKIFSDITELKKIRMQFENSVRAVAQSHLSMLDQARKVMPNPEYHAANLDFKDENQTIKNNVQQAVARAAAKPVEN